MVKGIKEVIIYKRPTTDEVPVRPGGSTHHLVHTPMAGSCWAAHRRPPGGWCWREHRRRCLRRSWPLHWGQVLVCGAAVGRRLRRRTVAGVAGWDLVRGDRCNETKTWSRWAKMGHRGSSSRKTARNGLAAKKTKVANQVQCSLHAPIWLLVSNWIGAGSCLFRFGRGTVLVIRRFNCYASSSVTALHNRLTIVANLMAHWMRYGSRMNIFTNKRCFEAKFVWGQVHCLIEGSYRFKWGYTHIYSFF